MKLETAAGREGERAWGEAPPPPPDSGDWTENGGGASCVCVLADLAPCAVRSSRGSPSRFPNRPVFCVWTLGACFLPRTETGTGGAWH
jgi:hypothetical protein